MDLAERQATNISLVLLEGERCFDKVDQCRLVETTIDYQLMKTSSEQVRSIHRESKFRVVRGKKIRFSPRTFRNPTKMSFVSVYILYHYHSYLSQLSAICHDMKSILTHTKANGNMKQTCYKQMTHLNLWYPCTFDKRAPAQNPTRVRTIQSDVKSSQLC